MNIKKLTDSKIEINVAIPWEEWKKYLDEATQEISKELKIPGFRPGKAPRNLVEKKVGKETILNQAAEKAIQRSYVREIIKEKIESLGRPEVKIKNLAEGEALEYSAQVEVMPEVKIQEDYKKEIKKINEDFQDKKIEISGEEIRLELEKLANSRAKLVTVLREARKNDSVEIDFTISIGGVPIEGGISKKHPLIIGRGVFIPGFEENLIGMRENEEKEFELEFPKDYHKQDLAGKKANFKVKVNLVQERQVPEINDELARSLGKFEKLNDLCNNIREGLEYEQKNKLKDQKRTKYVDSLIDHLDVSLPEVLINSEINQMLAEFEYQIQTIGGINLEDYLKKLGKDKEELKKDWRPQAEKRVTAALALREIAKLEKIKIEAKEIEAEMNKTLKYYRNIKDVTENIDMERLYNYVKGNLENEKVFEMLEKL